MKHPAYHILFLCTGNSARSIMAESILNRLGQGKFKAYSAGSQPKGCVHPCTLETLRDHQYDTAGLLSKSWDEFTRPDAPPLDWVITLCDDAAQEACPILPGHPVSAYWGLPDPAAMDGSNAAQQQAFVETPERLTHYMTALIDVYSADWHAMQLHLQAIHTNVQGKESPHGNRFIADDTRPRPGLL
jgi:protein-tyrosine-phosphatase